MGFSLKFESQIFHLIPVQIWMNCVALWPWVSYEILLIYRAIGIIKWVVSYETLSRVPEHSTKLGNTSCNYYFISGQTQCCLIPCSMTGEMGRVQDPAGLGGSRLSHRQPQEPWGMVAHWYSSLDGQLILMLQQRKEGILTVWQNPRSAAFRSSKTYPQGNLVADSRSWDLRLESRDKAIFRGGER